MNYFITKVPFILCLHIILPYTFEYVNVTAVLYREGVLFSYSLAELNVVAELCMIDMSEFIFKKVTE